MRYSNFRAFKKHLASAAPDHLSRCYLVAVPDEYERRVAVQTILSFFSGRPQIFLDGNEAVCRDVSDALLSPSLFGGDPVVIVNEAEKMGKKELQLLGELALRSDLYGFLICATGSKTQSLGTAFEKGGVVFDLADEKPWDKEKRLAEQASEQAQIEGKRIAPDALQLLFERLGDDAALLDREMEKLICFVGTKLTIERSDVFRISSATRSSTLWQIAEALIWESQEGPYDAASFHGLVPALRSQLQTGLKILELIEGRVPREEWSGYLPRIWPKQLEKRAAQAVKLGRPFFKKGIDLLFDIELLSRTGSGRESVLLDFFRISLQYARK